MLFRSDRLCIAVNAETDVFSRLWLYNSGLARSVAQGAPLGRNIIRMCAMTLGCCAPWVHTPEGPFTLVTLANHEECVTGIALWSVWEYRLYTSLYMECLSLDLLSYSMSMDLDWLPSPVYPRSTAYTPLRMMDHT